MVHDFITNSFPIMFIIVALLQSLILIALRSSSTASNYLIRDVPFFFLPTIPPAPYSLILHHRHRLLIFRACALLVMDSSP